MDDVERLARALHAILAKGAILPASPADYDAMTDVQRGQFYEFARRLDTMMQSKWAKPKNEATQVGDGSPDPTPPESK